VRIRAGLTLDLFAREGKQELLPGDRSLNVKMSINSKTRNLRSTLPILPHCDTTRHARVKYLWRIYSDDDITYLKGYAYGREAERISLCTPPIQ
jgi:hypothetical protein